MVVDYRQLYDIQKLKRLELEKTVREITKDKKRLIKEASALDDALRLSRQTNIKPVGICPSCKARIK